MPTVREGSPPPDVAFLDLNRRELRLPSAIQENQPSAALDLDKWGADLTRALGRSLDRRWKHSGALGSSRQRDRRSPRTVAQAVRRLAEIAEGRPQTVEMDTGDLSQRQAVKELNASRRTIHRSIKNRAKLCGL